MNSAGVFAGHVHVAMGIKAGATDMIKTALPGDLREAFRR